MWHHERLCLFQVYFVPNLGTKKANYCFIISLRSLKKSCCRIWDTRKMVSELKSAFS